MAAVWNNLDIEAAHALISRSGVLRTQKLKTRLLRTKRLIHGALHPRHVLRLIRDGGRCVCVGGGGITYVLPITQ